MRLSIKTKQVAGVTVIVGLAMAVLSVWYMSSLVDVLFEESRARAELVAKTTYHRAFAVLSAMPAGADEGMALRNDDGLKSILESNAYSKELVYAAIVDGDDRIVAHNIITNVGLKMEPALDMNTIIDGTIVDKLRTIYRTQALEYRQDLLPGMNLGSIRIGVSSLLLRDAFQKRGWNVLMTNAGILVAASLIAMLLGQIVLRPIHVIRGGLARLGRGELDVNVDLPADRDLGEIGDSFRQVTARLAAGQTELAGQKATLESVVDRLEDAVALFAPDGTLLFANPAMRPSFAGPMGTVRTLLPVGHPYRTAVESALASGGGERSREAPTPVAVDVPGAGERLILVQTVRHPQGRALGVMLVARNLAYLTEVETTLSYSRKLAALSRLTAGIAHEIKNPLNATMIHLELLKMKMAATPDAQEHVTIIASQVRRLDEVVQGLLKFTRPEDLRLEPVYLSQLVSDLMPVITAEAGTRVDVRVEVPTNLPPAQADPRLLSQAFLNLALNACQAMPDGGRLRIAARTKPSRWLEIEFEDTGIGIAAEDLPRIFDLYFTRRTHGSGIGLSLVFRTVQLHDGDIEVQSIPGRGTTFKLQLRQATTIPTPAVAAPAS